jgi:uncharacterized protein (TIGR02246 family)
MRYNLSKGLIVGWLCISGLTAAAQETVSQSTDQSVTEEPGNDIATVETSNDETTNDEAAVRVAIQSYVDAFNARDVDQLVGLWSPNGVCTSRTAGDATVGREALASSFKEVFDNPETAPKIAVVTDSIDFVSPNVALERGMAIVTQPTGEIDETQYSVVYVRYDGQWLIDRVTEEAVEPTHYQQLQVLEGLIGDWVGEDEGFRIEVSNQWTAKQNFIASQYKIVEDQVESSGLQVIGWDAKENKIKSWLFDSDGGVVTGTWNKRDDGWAVLSVATLGGGESGSFTGVLRLKDDGNYSWEKINQVVDGQLLPNIDEVVLNRQ